MTTISVTYLDGAVQAIDVDKIRRGAIDVSELLSNCEEITKITIGESDITLNFANVWLPNITSFVSETWARNAEHIIASPKLIKFYSPVVSKGMAMFVYPVSTCAKVKITTALGKSYDLRNAPSNAFIRTPSWNSPNLIMINDDYRHAIQADIIVAKHIAIANCNILIGKADRTGPNRINAATVVYADLAAFEEEQGDLYQYAGVTVRSTGKSALSNYI